MAPPPDPTRPRQEYDYILAAMRIALPLHSYPAGTAMVGFLRCPNAGVEIRNTQLRLKSPNWRVSIPSTLAELASVNFQANKMSNCPYHGQVLKKVLPDV